MAKRLVVASNNRHKIQEIQAILGSGWSVFGVVDIAPGLTWSETGGSFLENARIKLSALRAHTSESILADDSGLCVDALAGKPGVDSSSFGGVEGDHERNIDRLLRDLSHVPAEKRSAHFYCLLLYVDKTGRESRYEGRCHGKIATSRSGRGGFGYDPVFIPEKFGITLAEMTETQKNEISHRGLAMSAFKAAQKVT